MKTNKNGFTLIELLAVILILGIIALIAIPTVNKVLQESRVGAWKSTGNQMARQAESYYQLRGIKDGPYINDFKTMKTSDDTYATIDASGVIGYEGSSTPTDNVEKIMIAALEIKGDLPAQSDILEFKIGDNGGAKLKFKTANALCITTEDDMDDEMSETEFNQLTITEGANVQCAGIK